MAFKTRSSAPGEEMGRALSVKSFGWDKSSILEKIFLDKENDLFLMRVVGVANGTKPYTSRDKGDDGELLEGFGILGDFECTGSSGEILKGSKVYLPGYITEAIVGHLVGNPDSFVNCAFDLYARFDGKSATSYVYVGRALLSAPNPQTEKLKERLSSTPLPALAAPQK